MTVTRHAKAAAQELADQRRSALKTEYRRKLLRLQTAFEPPLSSKELAEGLGIESRDLGRFLSESPRLRHARPDTLERALIDAVLDGDLLIAAQQAVAGSHRSVLICDERDVKLLSTSYRVRNLAGGEVPERQSSQPEDWDDDALWDLFQAEPEPTKKPAKQPTAKAVPSARSKSKRRVVGGVTGSAEASEGSGAGIDLPLTQPPKQRALVGRQVSAVGLGAMRLSTAGSDGRPDEQDAKKILHRALELGVGLIDTADSYALDDTELGHNERLIAEVLRESEHAENVVVATKAGLMRPGGKWLPNGRPEHLRARCEASLEHLGLEAIDLFQLHVVDPKVPLAESVGELSRLRDEGKIRHVGLCNVNVEQLEAAIEIVPVASVQNAASLFDKVALDRDLAAYCARSEIAFIAHSPIGGHRGVGRADKDRALKQIAQRHGVSPRQVALAGLLHMSPSLLAIPGATSVASVEASWKALELQLDDQDFALLSAGRRAWVKDARRKIWAAHPPTPGAAAAEKSLGGAQGSADEQVSGQQVSEQQVSEQQVSEQQVVVFVGPPAAGKTSRVQPYLDKGYMRLNRDELGGKLSGLVVKMQQAIEGGIRSFVLDNTYATRETRRPVLELAREHGLPVRCLWIDTPVEESLYNACLRMLDRQQRILSPAEILQLSKDDPNMLPPAAIFHYFRSFEPPELEEGFTEIERIAFERRIPPGYDTKALLLDYDGTLRRSTGPAPFPMDPDHVEILPGRREVLDRYVAEGWKLLGVSNQSAIGKRQMTHEVARACFERTNELLGHDIEVVYSPHPTHRAGVWDRKPMPGLGVQLIEKFRLDRRQCLMVGDLDSDRLFAEHCGFEYRDQAEFFGK